MTTNSTPTRGRRRLISASGDGAGVYRRARDYPATAAITVAPDADTRAELLNHPAVILTVLPDGSWTVAQLPPGGYVPVPVASGHVDQVPPAGFRFNQHTRPDGAGCPWSMCSVVEPAQRTRPGDRRCPDRCPASDVEHDPNSNPSDV